MNGNTASVGYRYVTRQPGVRGGHAIIEGTRIGVHDVIGLLQNRETVDTIVTRCFPNITRAQVYECLAYTRTIAGRLTCWWPAKWPPGRREISPRPRRS
jgi:uncharacterized protein (DUF433 family)